MGTYITRFGDRLDLRNWPDAHVKWLRQMYQLYYLKPPYEEFVQRLLGPNSPVLSKKRNGPVPTRTPLYEAATDLQFRLRVSQGLFVKDWVGGMDPEWPIKPAPE